MISTNKDKKTLDWAVKIFRPVMKDLQIQKLEDNSYSSIFTSNYKAMNRYNMVNCIIVAKRCHFSSPEQKGFFVWQYDKETGMYAMYILINDCMYHTEEHEKDVCRKAVTTHEFTHCAAALMTISELKTDILIEHQQKKLSTAFHYFESSDINKLFADLTIPSGDDPKTSTVLSFPDEHFRTGDEDFQSSYSDLYKQLLLCYDMFREFFTDDMMSEFITSILGKNNSSAEKILSSAIENLGKEKLLDIKFIALRFREEFIKKIAMEYVQKNRAGYMLK